MIRTLTLILIFGLSLCSVAQSQQQVANQISEIRHLQVRGQASVASVPDMFHFDVYLEERGELLSKLNNVVSHKSAQIVKSLLDLGIEKRDIQSMRVQLSPWYEHKQSVRQQKGFVLSRQIKITMRDMGKYDLIIDGLLRIGATRIEGFNYALENPQGDYLKALELALGDAKTTASKMAKAMNLKVGKVLSMQEGSGYSPMPHARESLMKADSGGYMPGRISTNAQVTILFELVN
jgi:uncharacterized protein YggE